MSKNVPPEVIVVGPPEVWRRVVAECRVIGFRTLEELDAWRENRVADDRRIHRDLLAVLMELGCPLASLPRKLRAALEAIGELTHVPPTRELEQRWPSRRSFYRSWHERIEATPAAFLRRVRALHARRLLASGRTKKEAALLAGYSSVDQMRRNLVRDKR